MTDHNSKPAESNAPERITAILDELTLEEKIDLLHGDLHSGGVERLGIPTLVCADGPLGIRLAGAVSASLSPTDGEVQIEGLVQSDFTATALPSTLALAATFDLDAAEEYGRLLGREARAAGIHVMFGPGLNLMRDPRCGRNFEYLGEDPLLTADLGVAYIQGLQSQGVAACAKHYYANDAEHPRHYMSSNLDGRTAWEVHLAPFAAACRKAGVWSVMTGNNLVNGKYISENPDHLKGILRDQFDWDGVIFTDWRAAYTPEGCIEAGLTMTTGFCSYVFGDGRLARAVADGTIGHNEIDGRARDVLTLYDRVGLLDEPHRPAEPIDIKAHRQTARRLAREGMVLLKNEKSLLPLPPADAPSLLITGPGAEQVASGTGSSKVAASVETTPAEALAELYDTVTCEADASKAEDIAGKFDAVIYFATGPSCGEGFDLTGIRVDAAQENEIAALAKSTDRLVVVLQCGTAIDMAAWIDKPAAVLIAWLGGQMLGAAVGDILSGQTSPSGKLPCTLARSVDDYPCSRLGLWPAKLLLDEHPPTPGFKPEERVPLHAYDADYQEGVLIGYRWFTHEKIEPLYPFGFGLSYTTFDLSDFNVEATDESIRVTCTITNTGARAGAETVQVYVQPPKSPVDRPIRELKGFAKVRLAPGQSENVTIELHPKALAYFDADAGRWTAPAGTYRVQAGASCEHVLAEKSISIEEDRHYTV